jgi:hypothetical protein
LSQSWDQKFQRCNWDSLGEGKTKNQLLVLSFEVKYFNNTQYPNIALKRPQAY